MEDFYELLQLDCETPSEVIKKHCQELLLKYHPDKSQKQEENESMYLKIQEARKVLLNVEERKHYDRKLKESKLNKQYPVFSYVKLEELDFDEETGSYYMECRCGGEYLVDAEQLNSQTNGSLHIPCDDCTYHIVVTVP